MGPKELPEANMTLRDSMLMETDFKAAAELIQRCSAGEQFYLPDQTAQVLRDVLYRNLDRAAKPADS